MKSSVDIDIIGISVIRMSSFNTNWFGAFGALYVSSTDVISRKSIADFNLLILYARK